MKGDTSHPFYKRLALLPDYAFRLEWYRLEKDRMNLYSKYKGKTPYLPYYEIGDTE